jgi:hypothetical protein
LFSKKLTISDFYNLFTTFGYIPRQLNGRSEVPQWPRMIGDRVLTDGRTRIGAVAWTRDPMSKSDYKGNGGRTVVGDPVSTDGLSKTGLRSWRPKDNARKPALSEAQEAEKRYE